MHDAHLNAEETIDDFTDREARYMIPTQWGTFHLGNEPIGYSVLGLKRVMKARGLDASQFTILDIGQSFRFPRNDPASWRWITKGGLNR